MRSICACGSITWFTLTSCFVCGDRCCNECGEQYGAFQCVCEKCIANASEVIEVIRPEFYDVLLEMQDHHAATIAEQPVSLELYRLIVNCKSISEVVRLFEKYSVSPSVPVQKHRRITRDWTGKKAA